jgi:hypothetical protein
MGPAPGAWSAVRCVGVGAIRRRGAFKLGILAVGHVYIATRDAGGSTPGGSSARLVAVRGEPPRVWEENGMAIPSRV